MIRSLRTYKLLIRTVVLVVFMASVLPGIAHACMMANAHDGVVIKECCCNKSQHGDHHGTYHGYKGMNHGSHEMDAEEKKCDDHNAPKDHHDATLDGDCCKMSVDSSSFDMIMSRTNKITQDELLFSSILFLHAQPLLSLPTVKPKYEGIQDTGPPSSLFLSLHILYARFLN